MVIPVQTVTSSGASIAGANFQKQEQQRLEARKTQGQAIDIRPQAQVKTVEESLTSLPRLQEQDSLVSTKQAQGQQKAIDLQREATIKAQKAASLEAKYKAEGYTVEKDAQGNIIKAYIKEVIPTGYIYERTYKDGNWRWRQTGVRGYQDFYKQEVQFDAQGNPIKEITRQSDNNKPREMSGNKPIYSSVKIYDDLVTDYQYNKGYKVTKDYDGKELENEIYSVIDSGVKFKEVQFKSYGERTQYYDPLTGKYLGMERDIDNPQAYMQMLQNRANKPAYDAKTIVYDTKTGVIESVSGADKSLVGQKVTSTNKDIIDALSKGTITADYANRSLKERANYVADLSKESKIALEQAIAQGKSVKGLESQSTVDIRGRAIKAQQEEVAKSLTELQGTSMKDVLSAIQGTRAEAKVIYSAPAITQKVQDIERAKQPDAFAQDLSVVKERARAADLYGMREFQKQIKGQSTAFIYNPGKPTEIISQESLKNLETLGLGVLPSEEKIAGVPNINYNEFGIPIEEKKSEVSADFATAQKEAIGIAATIIRSEKNIDAAKENLKFEITKLNDLAESLNKNYSETLYKKYAEQLAKVELKSKQLDSSISYTSAQYGALTAKEELAREKERRLKTVEDYDIKNLIGDAPVLQQKEIYGKYDFLSKQAVKLRTEVKMATDPFFTQGYDKDYYSGKDLKPIDEVVGLGKGEKGSALSSKPGYFLTKSVQGLGFLVEEIGVGLKPIAKAITPYDVPKETATPFASFAEDLIKVAPKEIRPDNKEKGVIAKSFSGPDFDLAGKSFLQGSVSAVRSSPDFIVGVGRYFAEKPKKALETAAFAGLFVAGSAVVGSAALTAELKGGASLLKLGEITAGSAMGIGYGISAGTELILTPKGGRAEKLGELTGEGLALLAGGYGGIKLLKAGTKIPRFVLSEGKLIPSGKIYDPAFRAKGEAIRQGGFAGDELTTILQAKKTTSYDELTGKYEDVLLSGSVQTKTEQSRNYFENLQDLSLSKVKKTVKEKPQDVEASFFDTTNLLAGGPLKLEGTEVVRMGQKKETFFSLAEQGKDKFLFGKRVTIERYDVKQVEGKGSEVTIEFTYVNTGKKGKIVVSEEKAFMYERNENGVYGVRRVLKPSESAEILRPAKIETVKLVVGSEPSVVPYTKINYKIDDALIDPLIEYLKTKSYTGGSFNPKTKEISLTKFSELIYKIKKSEQANPARTLLHELVHKVREDVSSIEKSRTKEGMTVKEKYAIISKERKKARRAENDIKELLKKRYEEQGLKLTETQIKDKYYEWYDRNLDYYDRSPTYNPVIALEERYTRFAEEFPQELSRPTTATGRYLKQLIGGYKINLKEKAIYYGQRRLEGESPILQEELILKPGYTEKREIKDITKEVFSVTQDVKDAPRIIDLKYEGGKSEKLLSENLQKISAEGLLSRPVETQLVQEQVGLRKGKKIQTSSQGATRGGSFIDVDIITLTDISTRTALPRITESGVGIGKGLPDFRKEYVKELDPTNLIDLVGEKKARTAKKIDDFYMPSIPAESTSPYISEVSTVKGLGIKGDLPLAEFNIGKENLKDYAQIRAKVGLAPEPLAPKVVQVRKFKVKGGFAYNVPKFVTEIKGGDMVLSKNQRQDYSGLSFQKALPAPKEKMSIANPKDIVSPKKSTPKQPSQESKILNKIFADSGPKKKKTSVEEGKYDEFGKSLSEDYLSIESRIASVKEKGPEFAQVETKGYSGEGLFDIKGFEMSGKSKTRQKEMYGILSEARSRGKEIFGRKILESKGKYGRLDLSKGLYTTKSMEMERLAEYDLQNRAKQIYESKQIPEIANILEPKVLTKTKQQQQLQQRQQQKLQSQFQSQFERTRPSFKFDFTFEPPKFEEPKIEPPKTPKIPKLLEDEKRRKKQSGGRNIYGERTFNVLELLEKSNKRSTLSYL